MSGLNYHSIRKCNKIKNENIEYYLAEYDELGRFGNKFTFYPDRYYNNYRNIWGWKLDIWTSSFSNITNEDELHNIRRSVIYVELIYYWLCINFLKDDLCDDVIKYIKILYCQDIDLPYLANITIM